jgi:hypothetical protein
MVNHGRKEGRWTRKSPLVIGAHVAAAILIALGNVYAQETPPDNILHVVIDPNGNIAPLYREKFRELQQRATQDGSVKVWIALRVDYDPLLDPGSEAFDRQETAIASARDFVLGQLHLAEDAILGMPLGAPYLSAALTANELRSLAQTRVAAEIFGLP